MMEFAQNLIDEVDYAKYFGVGRIALPKNNFLEIMKEVGDSLSESLEEEARGNLSSMSAQALINAVDADNSFAKSITGEKEI